MEEENKLSEMEKELINKIVNDITSCSPEIIACIVNILCLNYYNTFLMLSHMFVDCNIHHLSQLSKIIDFGKIFRNEANLIHVNKEDVEDLKFALKEIKEKNKNRKLND